MIKLRQSIDEHPELLEALKEAEAQERFDRTAAFLGLPEAVCGVECRPLTLNDAVMLDSIGSPLFVGGPVKAEDIGAFIKLQCTRRNRFSMWRTLHQLGKEYTLEKAFAEIDAFISEAFADAPSSGEKVGQEYWTGAHSLVHVFGKSYGWTIGEILNTPLKVLFPLLNIMQREGNPQAPLFNPRSDKVRGDWLRKVNSLCSHAKKSN